MSRRALVLAALLVLLLTARCGALPTAAPGPGRPATPAAYPPPPTAPTSPPTIETPPTPEPTWTPRPTLPPAPTPIQPTPYVPREPLPPNFPAVVYTVQRPGQAVQLWRLRYEEGLLREELWLDLAPESLANCLRPDLHIGYAWPERLAFSPDGHYLALGLMFEEGIGTTLMIRIEDGKVFLPPTPLKYDTNAFLAWIPGREWFVWAGAHGANWGTTALDGAEYVIFPVSDVLDAVVSADGRTVIFSSIPSADIWLGAVDVDGSNLLPYPLVKDLLFTTKGRGYLRNLVLSPDGHTCAFVKEHDVTYLGGGQVWTMDVDGSNQRPLGPDDTYDFDLAWSPDGRNIAFARVEKPESDVLPYDPAVLVSSLWLIDVESDKEHLLLSSEGQYAHWSPEWLPDGSGLVFLSNRGGQTNLWFVHPDSTGLQQLTYQGGLVSEIALFPR